MNLVAWNIVRNTSQVLLEDVGSIVAMAVDPLKGVIFIAEKTIVRKHAFQVSLGPDYMTPSPELSNAAG